MMTTAKTSVGGYDSFAPWYDAFTAGSDYEAWTSHVLELSRAYGLRGTRALDVACGTGKSFLPLRARGFEITACDSSAAMLAEAARKAPDVALIEADMRELPALGEFDLVTCFDDSLNHLTAEGDLDAAFASIAANLAPSGLLLFDLNTLLAYRTTFAVDAVSTHDRTTFVWRGESGPDVPPGCQAAATIDVFAEREDGLYERVSTRYTQRHFPSHGVTARLAEAGLACLGVHGVLDDGSCVPEADEVRQLKVMYAARLAKGGDHE
jgi:ubiquinone/menaquinone biosynthesis C-methylase UbiE